jgi:hypothetical protein
MIQYLTQRELEDQPLHLTDEQVKSPYKVLEDFCADYNLGEVRQNLFESVKISLAEENDLFRDAKRRARAFDWYIRARTAMEAIFVVVNNRASENPGNEPK